MLRDRQKLLIIDGYNVLRSGSRYKSVSDSDFADYTDDAFNAARERLINDVAAYAERTWRAVIVFDAADNAYSDGSSEFVGGVEIMFTPAGRSADTVIEKLAYDACKHMTETLVVTSDAAIQDTVFGGGVDRMSAEDFSREIAANYREMHLDEMPEVAKKNTIADRIDAQTLADLKTLRDAEH